MKLPSNLSIDQVMDAAESDENIGFCLSCGEMAHGCEPDSRNYECEVCGALNVFGCEEIVLMFI